MDVLVDEFMDYIIALASGEVQTNNEKYGFKEIAILKMASRCRREMI